MAGDESPVVPRVRARPSAVALVGYLVVLAVIGFWPTPVDRPMVGGLAELARLVPWLSYPRVEFSANILLFVPLGALAAACWPRRRQWVIPAAFAVSLLIEAIQGILLTQRTPSIADVVANTAGAALGLFAVSGAQLLARRFRASRVR